jgi:hypothetical protein
MARWMDQPCFEQYLAIARHRNDFIRDSLAIDVGVVVPIAHAQQSVLPHLNQALGRGVKALLHMSSRSHRP